MFHLMKLAAYALFAYAVYEFMCGLTSEETGMRRHGGARSGRGVGVRYAPPVAGDGGVRRERSQETSGQSVPHAVGRGAAAK